MAQKNLESLLRELQKTVLSLSQKVNSLESKVSEQNLLINNQIEVISQLKCFPKTSHVSQPASAATPTSVNNKALQRTVRQVRLKPKVTEAALAERSSAAVVASSRASVVSDTSGAMTPATHQTELVAAVPQQQTLSPRLNDSASVNKENGADIVNDEDWHTVTKRSRQRINRQKAVVRGSGIFDCDLQTVERVKKIHACFFKPDTSEEVLKSYMIKKNNSELYEVKKINLKHKHYASFIITVPESKFDYFMGADNWPARTEIREWFRRGTGRAMWPLTKSALRGPADAEPLTGVKH